MSQQLAWTDMFTSPNKLVTELIRAFDDFPDSSRVRALVITNPHNPFGKCYSAQVLKSCVDFCKARNLHYISDEVYALSVAPVNESPGEAGFISALSFANSNKSSALASNGTSEGLADNARNEGSDRIPITSASENIHDLNIHVIWSISKDLGCSGLKLVKYLDCRQVKAKIS